MDAIHLASMVHIRKELTVVVTYDHRLAQACADLNFPWKRLRNNDSPPTRSANSPI